MPQLIRWLSVRTRVGSWNVPEQRSVPALACARRARSNALEFGDRHDAVVLRLDLGVRIEFETPWRRPAPAAPGLRDGG